MARFLFLTKTHWSEPPRLRHQLARLLAGAGHDVVFFEKPVSPWRTPTAARTVEPRITVAGYRELLHHKLRLAPPLHRLNARIALHSLRSALPPGPVDAVVNFNYEYWFAGALAPSAPLVTVINDDHVATALLGWEAPLRWALRRTCAASDAVLTVSRPLVESLRAYCEPRLFWPWADTAYTAPAPGNRDTLLFWGYVNDRLDFDLLERLADAGSWRLLIVGPVAGSVSGPLRRLAARATVEVRGPTPLDGLPLDRVLAALIPYRGGSGRIDAIELSNKALQLLARGLPLAISGMPQFTDEPFVYRMPADEPARAVRALAAGFETMQPDIRAFVARNGADARLAEFMEMVTR